jgi:photosystem II stability/assembly factor-like uncharacterized protein
MVWRNIGPFRGGRVAAVSGVIGQTGTFYMGLPLGGVWKTTSAGTTWYPVMDSVKEASSVGSVAVAPSDPNTIYVGMGDLITGGGINEGNGVYKSTDAGKTWQHLGLDDTRQIPSILVDPHDPNLVMVAAQGNVHALSETRGLYRSTDGGKTWTKTLYVDNQTGIQKIAWAFDKPSVMLATTVRHYNAPGAGGRGAGGGLPAGGTYLYKSTDEGLTWKKLTSPGLPTLAGRTCVAIADNTNAQRMYLVGNFGLYRSDDGGDHWRHMDEADRRVSNGQGGYNCGVYVNPKNPDNVYVINTSSYISTDGGTTFTGFKGAPGGDDPQQMWLDPTDGNRLFLGTDQGATISLDGGLNWSSWYNQATAQVYHISVDNQYPYWVYATQQDSGSIGSRSRGNLGAVTPMDWLPHPGYEFGSIVADPLNPNITYAGGPSGGIIKVTYPSGQWIDVSPSVVGTAGLRKVGNQPLGYSPTNPKELFAGFQYLMSTTDGGMHWKKLGGDLGLPKGYVPPVVPGTTPPQGRRPGPRRGPTVTPTETPKPDAVKPQPIKTDPTQTKTVEGDADKMKDNDQDDDDEGVDPDSEPTEQQGPAGTGSIESFSPSSIDGNIIWVGTSNGLVKLTKDHGKTWEDVTIPNLPNPTRADISAIDASHLDPGSAYVAIDYHNMADYKPYFYRTTDYGKNWTKIVSGMPTDQPSGSFARVIRSDTKRAGLLFAGTESSMYVSFNDGDTWQSLMINLPNTSYRDMVVHGNDLVVGTYGRGFWILDDISPLREVAASMATEPAKLFKPSDAIRVRRNVNGDTPFPPEVPHAVNPPLGAVIYYYLSHSPKSTITLDIADAAGKPIRHLSSDPIEPPTELPPHPDFWVEKLLPMPTTPGMHRINWNLRYDSPKSFSHSWEINANPGETNISPEGPLVEPGTYNVTLTVDGTRYTKVVTVKNDPRSPASDGAVRAQSALQRRLYEAAKVAWEGYDQVNAMRKTANAWADPDDESDFAKAATAFVAKLTAIGGTGGGGRRGGPGGFRPGGGPPPAPTFAGVDGALIRDMAMLDSGDMAPNEPAVTACKNAFADLEKVKLAWKTLLEKDLPDFNAVLVKNKKAPIPGPW